MSSSITKFNKNNKCCPRCNHYILNNIIQCKTIIDNNSCDYIFPHKDIDEKLRILKNESSLIKKFNRENQPIKVPKTPVKAKQSIKLPKTPVKAKQSKVQKTHVKTKQSIIKKKYNQVNEKKKECPRCKKYVYNATRYCKKLINDNQCGYIFQHKSIDEDVRNKKNNLSIQKKGIQNKGIQNKGIQNKGIQNKGIQNKGIKKKASKKQCPKCNLLTFPATKICKHIINNEICGYIFKKCKYTNKKKVSNKIKLGDDYLYEIKIDNDYMGNIKLDDKYIDEIKLDNKYLDENSNETKLDNKFIDEIKSIRKQLFKETWKDNTFNNLSDIESL